MAYCVHCGVKLGGAEPRCPLCGTKVVDPQEPRDENAEKPFPIRTPEQTLKANRKYAVSLLSLLLLLPAAICLVLDLLTDGLSWSIYPAGVLALVWIVFAMPMLLPKHRMYSTILITGAALAGYLYMVEQVSNTPGWFLPIVLPALALFVAMICFTVALVRKWKVRVLLVAAAAISQAGLLALFVELLCIGYGVGGPSLSWSPYVLIPCLFVSLLMFVISRNRPLYDEVKRRLHF